MSTYNIFTDGGAQPNPGIGAYAIAIVDSNNQICEAYCEGRLHATNNQMELEAMLLAYQYALAHADLTFVIHCDSKYVINGLTSWIERWKRYNWLNAAKEPVKNKELWQELAALQEKVSNVSLTWVKGHDIHEFNNAVDNLCNVKIRDIRLHGLSI